MADVGASVGMHNNGTTPCYNVKKDVDTVVSLLNQIGSVQGGTRESPLPPGASARALYDAIYRFQKKQNDLGKVPRLSVDGHVDPHGNTIARLTLVAGSAIPGLTEPPSLPPDWPIPPLPPGPEAPLARRFRIRYRGGGAMLFNLHRFDFHDVVNNVSAEYTMEGFGGGAGTPASVTGPGDFVDFVTPDFATVKNFGGPAVLAGTGAGANTLTLFRFGLFIPPISVWLSTGYTDGGDIGSGAAGILFLTRFHKGPPRAVPQAAGA